MTSRGWFLKLPNTLKHTCNNCKLALRNKNIAFEVYNGWATSWFDLGVTFSSSYKRIKKSLLQHKLSRSSILYKVIIRL